jgi:hypothetical protein
MIYFKSGARRSILRSLRDMAAQVHYEIGRWDVRMTVPVWGDMLPNGRMRREKLDPASFPENDASKWRDLADRMDWIITQASYIRKAARNAAEHIESQQNQPQDLT